MTRRSAWFAVLGCVGAVTFGTGAAEAHPHAWIDLRSTVLLGEEGRVRALDLEWLFDDFYTAFIAEEFAKKGGPAADFLTELAKTNLSQLAEYDYFTDVRVDGERVAVGPVTHFETNLRDNRLWLRFELPLAEPVDPRAGHMTFSIYDPTYYIEMLHLEGEPIAFRGPGAERCSAEIVPPNPSFEAVSLASALDRTQTAADGLGALFAESVEVTCQ